jgi:hypothetical protein
MMHEYVGMHGQGSENIVRRDGLHMLTRKNCKTRWLAHAYTQECSLGLLQFRPQRQQQHHSDVAHLLLPIHQMFSSLHNRDHRAGSENQSHHILDIYLIFCLFYLCCTGKQRGPPRQIAWLIDARICMLASFARGLAVVASIARVFPVVFRAQRLSHLPGCSYIGSGARDGYPHSLLFTEGPSCLELTNQTGENLCMSLCSVLDTKIRIFKCVYTCCRVRVCVCVCVCVSSEFVHGCMPPA